jgi:putative ABC transport system permease protein
VEGCPTGRGGSFYADIKGYGINLIKTYWFLLAAIFGAVLLIINPILVYGEGIASGDRLLYYTYIGLPTQIAGCLLLVPGMILLVEKYLTPLVARLLRLPTLLLASQLSGNLWRTLGTTLALSIGLSVYSFLEISGYSMLVPYMQSKTIPDTLVTFLPAGVPFSEVDTVRNTPGIDATRFLPIAVDQSQFSQTLAERFMNNGLIQMQTSAVIFGIDIDEAFGKRPDGSRPLIELPFQEGTLTSALEKLKTGGRYCLVPDSFAFRTDVHVGDKLELVLPSEDRGGRRTMQDERQSEEQIVEYEVCGIVSIHGWLWMNKISGVRKRGYRSGAMLLSPYETVKSDYRLKDAAYFWFDRTLNASGKPTVSDIALEQSLQQLADRQTAQTDGVSRPMVKVSSRNYLRERVGDRADEVIQAAAKMPLILLTISCFGMMGTIAASVRSRRFELGILRSLGVTRFRLIRLILAEAILIAIVVVVVSAGFGVIAGWCFIGLMKYVAGFGGFTSPLTIPMYHLAIGFLAAMGCCFLAALGPAVAAGRTAPTRLLQERV